MNDHNCGCIIAKPKPVAIDTTALDSLGKIALSYLQQYDTMHFYFANRTIEFYTDSSVLSYLHHLNTYLAQSPQQKIELYGYTDPKGTPYDNSQLATQRLHTLQQCLVRMGIKPTQIESTAIGEIGKCASDDELCLQQYRRVDAVLEWTILRTSLNCLKFNI